MPDLGREFSPAGADCGYRAPLAPRLARPSRWYLARSPVGENTSRGNERTQAEEGENERPAVARARVWERRDAWPRRWRGHRWRSGGCARNNDGEWIPLRIDGDADAAVAWRRTQREGEKGVIGQRRERLARHFEESVGPDHSAGAADGIDRRNAVCRDAVWDLGEYGRICISHVHSPDADLGAHLWDAAGSQVTRLLRAKPDDGTTGHCGVVRSDAPANGDSRS
jgi:hypothetical protein